MTNNDNKLTKKEKYKIAYISIYIVLIVALIIYSMANPEFMEQAGNMLDKLKNAFGLFAQ